jgi:hypothetical protein
MRKDGLSHLTPPVIAFITPLSSEQPPGVPGNHQFFVGLHDQDGDRTTFLGNDRSIFVIQVQVQMNTEKFQVGTDPGSDGGRVLADAAGEDEGIQPTQDRSQGSGSSSALCCWAMSLVISWIIVDTILLPCK